MSQVEYPMYFAERIMIYSKFGLMKLQVICMMISTFSRRALNSILCFANLTLYLYNIYFCEFGCEIPLKVSLI